ncbi:histidine phosphotransferase family protein [Roseobacter sp. HKCCA0434]|uniref:histidine phosphotransferase family protein n=1 Tax=Roseobacter sp. HKCCA0434 TaxID=3079297 RepID=UPI002905A5A4|nr:histidine phosphotransferase family protein [Roseobacter sp. HKCCA0434]
MSLLSLHDRPAPATQLDEDDLIGLVTSRICHDLISPIGAIDNGIELMGAMAGPPQGAEMGLIGESARAAGLKLKLLRLAFGTANSEARKGGAELSALFESAFDRPRLSFAVQIEPASICAARAKLATLALLCADGAMPFGGTLTLTLGAREVRLDMRAERLRWQEALWDGLLGNAGFDTVRAGEVHFPIARLHAERMGREFTLERDEGGAILTV